MVDYTLSKYIIETEYNGYVVLYHLIYTHIIGLSRETYLNIKTGKSEEVKEKTLQQLIDLGFLVPSTVDEKEIVKLKMNSLKYTPLQMGIFVSLTSACNLKCPFHEK